MKLSEYFENAKGIGVLATTDMSGQVNQAIYAKPLFLEKDDDGTCSFVMADRLTHDNVGHNPSAAYLFIEQGEGCRFGSCSHRTYCSTSCTDRFRCFTSGSRRSKIICRPRDKGSRKFVVIDG